jgi:hypothetical protein
MNLHIHIPEDKGVFSLFVHGHIMKRTTLFNGGTFLQCGGVAVLYYTYPHCRRAYIARHIGETRYYNAARLPNVEETVALLARARGRQIDLLRKSVYFLSLLRGERVYHYDTYFWQKVVCLIEQCKGRYSRSLRTNIEALATKYRPE